MPTIYAAFYDIIRRVDMNYERVWWIPSDMNCNVISLLKKLPDYAELRIPNETELLKAGLERFRQLKIFWMTEYPFYLHFINSLSKTIICVIISWIYSMFLHKNLVKIQK